MFFDSKYYVRNELSKINIEWFEIKGLFNRNNVKLDFEKQVNIYIGENGFGKTTVLNCIYYVLSKKYDKLEKIEFETINIKFKNDEKIYSISRNDVIQYNLKKNSRRKIINDPIYNDFLIEFFESIKNEKNYIDNIFMEEKIRLGIRKLSSLYGIPVPFARDMVYNYLNHGKLPFELNNSGNLKNVEKLNKALEEYVNQKVLYFTTYRRIEDDFSNIIRNVDDYSEADLLIKFGMRDVEKNIENILNTIKNESRENFNKMTGVLLKQYSSNNDKMIDYTDIEEEIVKIVLDRLSTQIDVNEKNNILEIIQSGKIYKHKYNYLLNLLNKLIDNYKSQLIYDEKINKFVETCNKYLHRKKFVYDQSELKLYIKMEKSSEKDGDYLPLSKLSSGEKQIVSMFSILYLEKNEDNIILIDEPELSISMHWQKMLLPDIIRSGNCKLLLTVTHSPFIFDNEFEFDAKEIRYSIEDSDWD